MRIIGIGYPEEEGESDERNKYFGFKSK